MTYNDFIDQFKNDIPTFSSIENIIQESTNVELDLCNFVKHTIDTSVIRDTLIKYNDKYNILANMFQMESTLTKKERDDLSDDDFGIPSKREFPIHDINHIKSAIRYFKYCTDEDKNTLANNIKKAIEKNGLEISHFKNSKFLNYVTESMILESVIPDWEIENQYKLASDDGVVKIALDMIKKKKIPSSTDFIAAVSGKYDKHSIDFCIRAIKQFGNGYLLPDFEDNISTIPKYVLWFSLTPIFSIDRIKTLLQFCNNELSRMLLVLLILGEYVDLHSIRDKFDFETSKKMTIDAYKEIVENEMEFLNREPMLEPIDYIMMESLCSNMYEIKINTTHDNNALKLFTTYFTEESITELLPKSEKILKEITPILGIPNKHIVVDNYFMYMENSELFCTGFTDDKYWTVQLTDDQKPLLECQIHCKFLDQQLSHNRLGDTVVEKSKLYDINDICCALESVINFMETSFNNNDTDGILESYDYIQTIKNQFNYMSESEPSIKYSDMYFSVVQKERYLEKYIKNHNLK